MARRRRQSNSAEDITAYVTGLFVSATKRSPKPKTRQVSDKVRKRILRDKAASAGLRRAKAERYAQRPDPLRLPYQVRAALDEYALELRRYEHIIFFSRYDSQRFIVVNDVSLQGEQICSCTRNNDPTTRPCEHRQLAQYLNWPNEEVERRERRDILSAQSTMVYEDDRIATDVSIQAQRVGLVDLNMNRGRIRVRKAAKKDCTR